MKNFGSVLLGSQIPKDYSEEIEAVIQRVEETAAKKIVFSPPMISLNGVGIIWHNTINIIQGKTGCHKSRMAELFGSLLIKAPSCETDFLGFSRHELKYYQMAYVDTERNQQEQFPAAIQNIRRKAGRVPTDQTDLLIPFSLLRFNRKERLKVLRQFIQNLHAGSSNKHTFILLDVITDCLGDFNNASETLELFDYLNCLINDFNVTILLVIHENPGSDKARGHTGTEASNKSSTVMQIGFVKDKHSRDTGIIKLAFQKVRNTKPIDPIYLQYCDQERGLIPADKQRVAEIHAENDKLEYMDEILKFLNMGFTGNEMPQKALISSLEALVDLSKNSIKSRLNLIEEQGVKLGPNQEYTLESESASGKPTIYRLVKANP